MKPLKIVKIVWEDIETHTGWIDAKDITECPVFETVGYLIERDKKYIKICDSAGGIGNVTIFPKGCVLKIDEIG